MPGCDNRPVTHASRPPSPRERVALAAGRLAGEATRRLGRGGGTALPGLVAGTLAPGLVEALARQPGHGAVTVTGTNGKTTTTHLIAAIASAAGMTPLTNRSGSNLERGLVTALVDAAGVDGRIEDADTRLGLFEVDEAALPALFPRLRPRVAVFLNLFRDQLDRYGEIDSVAAGWGRMLDAAEPPPVLVLNADDPSVAALGEGYRGEVVHFGIEDRAVALPEAEHAADARFCVCGARVRHEAIYMGHVGAWRCEACGRARPAPQVAATRIALGAESSEVEVVAGEERATLRLAAAGLYSVTNALAAIATAQALGVPLVRAAAAIEAAGPAFGRQERFEIDGRGVRIWLAKNPAGLNEIVRALLAAGRPLHMLAFLNDDIQDGQDVSWVYDADLERITGRLARLTCGGTRADDLALRFHIAGCAPDATIAPTATAFEAALAATPPGGTLDVVATYTAMIEVRGVAATRAGARAYWEAAP